jgi:hypothetical protein
MKTLRRIRNETLGSRATDRDPSRALARTVEPAGVEG